jgi:hypothetical protein
MHSTSTSVGDAQRDMRTAYFGGAPGMFASAAVWLAAGMVAVTNTPQRAVITLFVGGMFIYPLGMLFAKALGRSGAHARGNPLGALALESTGILLLSLPLAYVVFQFRASWFFPARMLVIGGRYLTFATLYGLRVYWVGGLTLAVAGWLLVIANAALPIGAFAGASIEAALAFWIIFATRDRDSRDASDASLSAS